MSEDQDQDQDESWAEDRSNLAGSFYRGTIERLFRGSQVGVVRSASGREIPFEFLHVSMVGPLRRYDDLREGMQVGFDVGWTSSGLRVTVLSAGDEGLPANDKLPGPDRSDGDV
jgi:hypothetical protein